MPSVSSEELSIGLLHPGEMGAAVGALIRQRGRDVLWAGQNRGPATRDRAEAAGFADVGDVAALAGRAGVVLSICPPHAARDVAEEVMSAGFRGTYVDANAVSPATARSIGELVVRGGATMVDGGIVGPPPVPGQPSRLYLSGPSAGEIAALFDGGPLEPRVVDDRVGSASAVKMTYAAWTKGTAALLLALWETAEAEGVADELLAEWRISQPALEQRLEGARSAANRKGWRWIAEMEEIADTFGAAGLPEGFHRAAADVYRRSTAPGRT